VPILEFRCGKCGKSYEWLKLSSKEEPVCPHCGSSEAARQMSVFAVGPGGRASRPDGCPSAADGSCPSAGHSCCPGCGHG